MNSYLHNISSAKMHLTGQQYSDSITILLLFQKGKWNNSHIISINPSSPKTPR